jgi:hypothetical protein
MRLLVKEVIVGKDLITIKHSIPGQAAPIGGNPQASKSPIQHNMTQIDKSYPLCKGRACPSFCGPFSMCAVAQTRFSQVSIFKTQTGEMNEGSLAIKTHR